MILKSFSWQHFLLAALGLGVLWYLGIWWYYRRKREAGEVPLQHRWQGQVDELDVSAAPSVDHGLLGIAALEHGVMVLEADQFGFADKPNADLPVEKTEQLGWIADVQQEIRSAAALLEKQDGNKEDFFAMMEMVKAKYPKLSGHPNAELKAFIRGQVPFHLSSEELDNLW